MKSRRPLIIVCTLACILIAASIALLMPPAEWNRIVIGMSQAEVRKIVPVFDVPWGDTKADFKYEKRGIFTWQLAVMWNPAGVDSVYREIWINWPERIMIIVLEK